METLKVGERSLLITKGKMATYSKWETGSSPDMDSVTWAKARIQEERMLGGHHHEPSDSPSRWYHPIQSDCSREWHVYPPDYCYPSDVHLAQSFQMKAYLPCGDSTERKSNLLTKMNKTLRRVLNANLRAIHKAGYINGNLEVTDRGMKVLEAILLQRYEKELAVEANEELEEKKSEGK